MAEERSDRLQYVDGHPFLASRQRSVERMGRVHEEVASQFRQQHFREAEASLRLALDDATVQRPDPRHHGLTLSGFGELYGELGRDAEAERYFRRSLAILRENRCDSETVAIPLGRLAALYSRMRRYSQAESVYQEALVSSDATRDTDPAFRAWLVDGLAVVNQKQGRYAEAERDYRKALAAYEGVKGSDSLEAAAIRQNLGMLTLGRGDASGAAELLTEADRVFERTRGSNRVETAKVIWNLAQCMVQLREYSKAESFYARAAAIFEKTLGNDHPLLGSLLAEYALVLRKTNQKKAAREMSRRAHEILLLSAERNPDRHSVDWSTLRTPAR